MKLNEREIPLRILQEEALLRNLPKECSKYAEIESDLARRRAGYWGETQLDYYLRQLPYQNYFILHDLRLPLEDDFFQIDVLILTPRYCLVIESKNFKGVLFFDGVFDQLIRIQEDLEESFEDPIVQAKNIILKLKYLLSAYFPDLPFDYLISIANPKTIIKSNTDKNKKVCHANGIVHKVFSLEKNFHKQIITPEQILDISSYLLKLNTPNNKSILTVFGLSRKDLKNGVFCPRCDEAMFYVKGNFCCKICKQVDEKEFLIKVIDYFLLFGPTATNSQLKLFLDIPSRYNTKHFLKKLNFSLTGQKRYRVYQISGNIRNMITNPANLLRRTKESK
ncbi:hypothetical protein AM500_02440 [Bacillus sp. FJAT-18017]|uniref:nuclease-related domain-containing protein n=1 Tax=Bacillus sp. FJAT-18017 TaxID=1705566 RepID=UPI0006AD9CA0|nr:nuclease-related domain-containing protein [Bacillus sp. FJAT-18017]ALC88783.1 hypothetical protein AM500_02440 [Bacillus sp. FJAT-18017]